MPSVTKTVAGFQFRFSQRAQIISPLTTLAPEQTEKTKAKIEKLAIRMTRDNILCTGAFAQGRQLAQVVGLAVGVVLLQNCGALEVVLRLAVPEEDDLARQPPPRQLSHPVLQPAEEDAARPLMKEERDRRAGQAGAREQLGGASRHRGSGSNVRWTYVRIGGVRLPRQVALRAAFRVGRLETGAAPARQRLPVRRFRMRSVMLRSPAPGGRRVRPWDRADGAW